MAAPARCKRMTREKADALFAKVLDRVRAFNADPEGMAVIDVIIGFGSFIREEADIGDIDLALVVHDHPRLGNKPLQAIMDATSHLNISLFRQMIYFRMKAYTEVRKVSPRISLHEVFEINELRCSNKILYYRHEDELRKYVENTLKETDNEKRKEITRLLIEHRVRGDIKLSDFCTKRSKARTPPGKMTK